MFGNRVLLLVVFFCACATVVAAQRTALPVDGYKVVHEYPHDPDAYTQGLVYVDGNLYEGTGRNGKSSIRMVELPLETYSSATTSLLNILAKA